MLGTVPTRERINSGAAWVLSERFGTGLAYLPLETSPQGVILSVELRFR
jgi:hypothetical protein